MKTKILLLLTAGLAVFAAGCKNSSLHPTSSPKVNDTAVDVYTGGYIDVTRGLGITQEAVYWKNGVITVLSDTSTISIVKGIAVAGADVYVIATQYGFPDGENAIVWKNGVPTKLSPDSTMAEVSCIGIQGNDVYIGGYTHNVISQTPTVTQFNNTPVYWKNGVVNKLPNATAINAVTINGNDIYFAGSEISAGQYFSSPGGTGSIAVYWKNGGSPVKLDYPSAYSPSYSSTASVIAVKGSNVYTAGYTEAYQPEMWKNTTPSILQSSVEASSAKSMAVSGNDVYIAGVSGVSNVATVWKNNFPLTLNIGSGVNMNNSEATSIALSGAHIYVAGSIKNATGNEYGAYFWKDGQLAQLSNGPGLGAFATCMVLAPKN